MSRSSMIFTGFLNGMNGLSQNQRQTRNEQQRIRQIEERFLRHTRSQLFPKPYRRKQRQDAQQDEPHIRSTDQSGAELPSTGGVGTTYFYALGGVLAVGAAVLLVTKKRAEQA